MKPPNKSMAIERCVLCVQLPGLGAACCHSSHTPATCAAHHRQRSLPFLLLGPRGRFDLVRVGCDFCVFTVVALLRTFFLFFSLQNGIPSLTSPKHTHTHTRTHACSCGSLLLTSQASCYPFTTTIVLIVGLLHLWAHAANTDFVILERASVCLRVLDVEKAAIDRSEQREDFEAAMDADVVCCCSFVCLFVCCQVKPIPKCLKLTHAICLYGTLCIFTQQFCFEHSLCVRCNRLCPRSTTSSRDSLLRSSRFVQQTS